MKSFEADASHWLGVVASGLKRPAFNRMHPSFLADISLLAYAGHESTYLNNIVGTLNRPENHSALRDEDDDPCWHLINQAPPGCDVHPDTPISYSTTDERIKVYSGIAVGYLQGRPEFSGELARLSARFFAGLDPSAFAMTSFYMGEDLVEHFGFGNKDGLSYLSELGGKGKKAADLGMGTHAVIYQNIANMPARILLADNNLFSAAFNRAYISLTGREGSYEVVDADFTLDPEISGIPPASIDHAGSRLLAHHIFNDNGDAGFEAFARFLMYILSPSGTFRIMDNFKARAFEQRLSGILRSAGFSIDTPSDSIARQFMIDGSK